MKNIKRVIALFVVTIMIFSLSGCQKKTNEAFFNNLENLSAFKEGDSSFYIRFKVPVENLPEDLGKTEDLDFVLSLVGESAIEKGEFKYGVSLMYDNSNTYITTIIAKDNKLYIDVKSIIKAVLSIDEVQNLLIEEIGSKEMFDAFVNKISAPFGDSGYVVIDIPENTADFSSVNTLIDTIKNSEFAKGLYSFFKTSILEMDPSVISKTKEPDFQYQLTLNGEQATALVKSLRGYMLDNVNLLYDMSYNVLSNMDDQLAINYMSSIAQGQFLEDTTISSKQEALEYFSSKKEEIIDLTKTDLNAQVIENVPSFVMFVAENRFRIDLGNGMYFSVILDSKETNITPIEDAVTFDSIASSLNDAANISNNNDMSLEGNENQMDSNEWKEEKNISINSITDEEIKQSIQKIQTTLGTLKYDDIVIDYSYGSYILSGSRGQEQTIEIEFDKKLGSKNNDYVYILSMYKHFSAAQNPDDAAQELTGDANMLLGMSLDSQDFVATYAEAKTTEENSASFTKNLANGNMDIFSFINGDEAFFLLNYFFA